MAHMIHRTQSLQTLPGVTSTMLNTMYNELWLIVVTKRIQEIPVHLICATSKARVHQEYNTNFVRAYHEHARFDYETARPLNDLNTTLIQA